MLPPTPTNGHEQRGIHPSIRRSPILPTFAVPDEHRRTVSSIIFCREYGQMVLHEGLVLISSRTLAFLRRFGHQ